VKNASSLNDDCGKSFGPVEHAGFTIASRLNDAMAFKQLLECLCALGQIHDGFLFEIGERS
jgi:hypothetical protein